MLQLLINLIWYKGVHLSNGLSFYLLERCLLLLFKNWRFLFCYIRSHNILIINSCLLYRGYIIGGLTLKAETKVASERMMLKSHDRSLDSVSISVFEAFKVALIH